MADYSDLSSSSCSEIESDCDVSSEDEQLDKDDIGQTYGKVQPYSHEPERLERSGKEPEDVAADVASAERIGHTDW